MNKLILIFLFGITTNSQAQINDYSNGNSNPFARYNYIAPHEQEKLLQLEQNLQPIQYFSSDLANPKIISKSTNSKGKYKHLINNAQHVQGCWDGAAKAYNLDPWLLMAIAKVESSFNSQAININKNKSTDIGMMQINTIWLPTLKKFGISKNDLLVPCTSIFVGAWIMAQNIKNFGYNQDGIGAYNSPRNVNIRRNYASKVYKAYHEITTDLYYNHRK